LSGRLISLALLATLAGAPAAASPEDGEWRTIRTEHFRLHYPADAEAWAEELGAQLESIRARVSEEIGNAPEKPVDIIIQDPFSQANGFAQPWLRDPRMGIWASPPGADSVIGNYRSWEEDLVVHEDAHLVHMMIPSRSLAYRLLVSTLLGVGPVTAQAPRWVTEGYATVVEGRLTGFGRPNSDGRALTLRRLAQEGRMPTYDQLNGSELWRGGAMAYLVGSAYLEWLEVQEGEGKLRELWLAMSARQWREFDEAFEHVFGEAPAVLYARFVAELTYSAMDIERQRPVVEGTLWQDLTWSTGAPAVSPDGSQIAVVVRDSEAPPRLVIWNTAEDPEPEVEWRKEVDEVREKDPEDPEPKAPEVFPREPEFERVRPDRSPFKPRWTPDGDLLFTAWMRAGDGRAVPDLVLWTPGGGERRVTCEAAVHSADPHPAGGWAVAIRQRWSESQLVKVDLETGEVTALTAPDVDAVLDHPRISPDGTQLAYLRNRDVGWRVVIRDLTSGAERELAMPAGAGVARFSWAPDSSGIFASVGLDGFVEAWFLPLSGVGARPVTASRGGAMSPEPTPDGQHLFFLSLGAEGMALHRVDLAQTAGLQHVAIDAAAPAVRPPPPPPIGLPERAEVSAAPYFLGGLGSSLITGVQIAGDDLDLELVGRTGDIAGRGSLLAMARYDVQAPGYGWNFAGAMALRALPVDLTLWGFWLDTALDESQARKGGEVDAEYTLPWASGGAKVRGGGWIDASTAGNLAPRRAGFAQLDFDQYLWLSRWWVAVLADAGGQLGASGDSPWRLGHGAGALEVGYWPVGLQVGYAYDLLYGAGSLEQLSLGGLRSSLYSPGYTASRLITPALPGNFAIGETHDAARVALVSAYALELAGERHRMWSGDEETAATFVALQLDVAAPPQPVFKIASVNAQLGASCLVEDPEEGWRDRACRSFDHYRFWAGLSWRP
jgi:hypothetical protein